MSKDTSSPKGKKKVARKRPPEKGQVVGMDAFKTRPLANEGIRFDLVTATGANSPHFLTLLGVDSDAFQKAKARQTRVIAELFAIKDEGEREDQALVATCDMLAVLVQDWSFSDPDMMPEGKTVECTVENVSKFLFDAPQIREQIDKLVSNRALFFKTRSSNLRNTSEGNSN